MFSKVKIRRDLSANWTAVDPILSLGEIGYETDTRLMKVGTGEDEWSALSYIAVDAHDNGSHSETFILASDVTYENLNSNGDVGTVAGTLCAGDDSRLTDTRDPNSHGNEAHSSSFIVAGDVTYENLNSNGDVGTGSGQLAIGDHNHDLAYSDISHTHTELHEHTNKAMLDEIEVAMKKVTFVDPVNASVDSVHAAIALADGTTTEVTTGITNPDMPRILSITGNAVGIGGNVVIVGTNANDESINETIVASGTDTVVGTKAFKTVTSITVPGWNVSGDTISIGVGNKLGLNRVVSNTFVFIAKFGNTKETTDPTITESVTLEENLIEFNSSPDGSTTLVCYFVEE